MSKIKYYIHHESPDKNGCNNCDDYNKITKINSSWSKKCKQCVFDIFIEELVEFNGLNKKEIRELFEIAFEKLCDYENEGEKNEENCA